MIPLSNSIKRSNVWEEALKHKEKDTTASQTEVTLIVVGQPASGKSNLIHILNSNPDVETKPTNLLNYTYIKRIGSQKQLMHCYEIASKTLTQTVCSLVSKDNFTSTFFLICIDLSKPQTAMENLQQWIEIIRKEGENIINETLLTSQQKYEQFSAQVRKQYVQNEDRDAIKPMPLHAVVIGCKYDIFQRYDTESRKWFSKALRYISHINYMSLFFSSAKSLQVGSLLKTYIHEQLFPQKKRIQSQFDHTRPIFINKGKDTIREMNLPSSGLMNRVQILRKQMLMLFGEKEVRKKEGLEVQKYMERRIDEILEERKRERGRREQRRY